MIFQGGSAHDRHDNSNCHRLTELPTFYVYCHACNPGSHLGDNCIQNIHLGRYIVGYTVENLVLRRRVGGAVKRDFRTYIRLYTSPNEYFEYGYPHSNALLNFSLKK